MARGVTRPRRIALDVFRRLRTGELVDRAMAGAAGGLENRDHAWLQELVYGTLRLRGRLDFILARFVRGSLGSLDPDVLDILRLGAYQLLEMGSVPAYAAISQSVELTRVAGSSRASGLVNAVLRAVRREGAEVSFPPFETDPVEHLVTWGSHPRWLVERWISRWGAEEARTLVEANNRRPDLFLSPVGLDPAEAIERLGGRGIDAERVSGFPDSLRVAASGDPAETLTIVPAVVQDPAAAIVARYAAFPYDSVVIDVSAAPGGKTVLLASTTGYVVAADVSASRLRRVRANVERTGLGSRVGLVVADGRTPPFRAVDGVLLDAPCSGTGTLRRHADGRWRISPGDLVQLAELQRELLAAVAPMVRPGGLLVYSTCSLEPEENERQIERFLTEHPEFVAAAPGAGISGTMTEGPYLRVLPQRHGVDGAFAARLMRSE